MITNVLTKALIKPWHETLREKMDLTMYSNKQSRSIEITSVLVRVHTVGLTLVKYCL